MRTFYIPEPLKKVLYQTFWRVRASDWLQQCELLYNDLIQQLIFEKTWKIMSSRRSLSCNKTTKPRISLPENSAKDTTCSEGYLAGVV